MKGRKPKPTALKVLQGNPGHRSLKPDSMQLEASPPCSGFVFPPAHIAGIARDYWFETAPKLLSSKLLSDIDWGSFASLCLAHEEVVLLTERINIYRRKKRLTAADDNALMTLEGRRRKSLDVFEKSAARFGMTPGARASVKIPSGQSEFPFAGANQPAPEDPLAASRRALSGA